VTLEIDPQLAVDVLKGSEDPIRGWVSRGYHRKVSATTLIAQGHCQGDRSFVCRLAIA
jgi:hypothetical protein